MNDKKQRLKDLRHELRFALLWAKTLPEYTAKAEAIKRRIEAENGSGVFSLYSRKP